MGWSYDDWVGPFYPRGTAQRDFLRLYSDVFDAVEVDSSFYSMPSYQLVEQWRNRTPEDFMFTLKLPRDFTHEGRLMVHPYALEEFENIACGLYPKLACVLIMMPPSSRFEHMFDQFRGLISGISDRVRYAVEFRNRSWFRSEVFDFLTENKVSLVWSVNQYVNTPPELTTDLVYLRFIGDRKITRFDRVQRDRAGEMNDWLGRLRMKFDEGRVKEAYVFSNNHFAGFAPGTVNIFRRLAGLEERDWRELMIKGESRQKGNTRQTSLDSSQFG